MTKCVLHVTDREYDKIAQVRHGLIWKKEDHELLERLETLVGKDVTDQVSMFDEIRVEKHRELSGIPRIQSV